MDSKNECGALVKRNLRKSQNLGPHFVRACAVEMHIIGISQVGHFHARIYSKICWGPESVPWSNPGLNPYRKNPSVWKHCLGKIEVQTAPATEIQNCQEELPRQNEESTYLGCPWCCYLGIRYTISLSRKSDMIQKKVHIIFLFDTSTLTCVLWEAIHRSSCLNLRSWTQWWSAAHRQFATMAAWSIGNMNEAHESIQIESRAKKIAKLNVPQCSKSQNTRSGTNLRLSNSEDILPAERFAARNLELWRSVMTTTVVTVVVHGPHMTPHGSPCS